MPRETNKLIGQFPKDFVIIIRHFLQLFMLEGATNKECCKECLADLSECFMVVRVAAD